MIWHYVSAEDGESADRALQPILQDPRASLGPVLAILKADPVYAPQPVGMMPENFVPLRGRRYHYGLYVPDSYQPTQPHALVICLHGMGFTGEAYLERWASRLGEGYILACPTLPRADWWSRAAEDLVLATIQEVQRHYAIDPDRIVLTGMSNGGIGAYIIGTHHADRFAALAPMAGGLEDVLFPFLQNLRNTAVYLLHGASDQVMPIQLSRDIDAELTRLGYPHVFREHRLQHPQAGGHFFPRDEVPALVAWLRQQRRPALPSHLTLVRDASHLGALSWARIDATDRIAYFSDRLVDTKDDLIKNRVYAELDVAVTGPNRIEVATTRVRRYSLYLNDELVDFSKPVTVVTNGKVSHEGLLTPSVERLLREARLRRDRRQLFPAMVTISVDATP
jgi:predicted esterase